MSRHGTAQVTFNKWVDSNTRVSYNISVPVHLLRSYEHRLQFLRPEFHCRLFVNTFAEPVIWNNFRIQEMNSISRACHFMDFTQWAISSKISRTDFDGFAQFSTFAWKQLDNFFWKFREENPESCTYSRNTTVGIFFFYKLAKINLIEIQATAAITRRYYIFYSLKVRIMNADHKPRTASLFDISQWVGVITAF